MIQKVFIGGKWLGLGDKWVDDEPTRCVDCLNVYATESATQLRKRPGIEHSVDVSSSPVYDLIAVRRKDDNNTIAGLLTSTSGDMIRSVLKQDASGILTTETYPITPATPYPVQNKHFTGRARTPFGIIGFGDRYPTMLCDRYWGYDYDGTNRIYSPTLIMANKPFDYNSNAPFGLYGFHGTYKEQLADGGAGSGILDAGEYGVFAVFEYRLPDDTYFGETTPYFYWKGEEATITLANDNSKITVTLPYKKSSTWNYHDLGYAYDLDDGAVNQADALCRGFFRPVKIRVYRTLKDLTGYYLLEKEIDISSVSHDGSGYITFDVGASGDLSDLELIDEYENWRVIPSYIGSGEWYTNRLFGATNEIHARITGDNHIYFSEVNNPFKFDGNNFLTLNGEDPITGLIGMPARGMVLILTTQGVQYLSGTSAANFTLAPMAHGSGCAWTGAFAKYRNSVFWAGRDGFYVLGDGAMQNISPKLVDLGVINWIASYSKMTSTQVQMYWFLVPYNSSENSYAIDLQHQVFWKWDIDVLDTYEPPISREVPPDSWDITSYGSGASEKSLGETTIICRKGDYLGTITLNSLVYGGNSSDSLASDTDISAYFITSWQQFGMPDTKRIGRVRLHASPDTRVKVRVEASPNPTFDTDLVPTAREMILTGNDFNQVSDIGISGRYIRFKIESVSGYEMVIYGLEVEVETDG